MPLRYRADRQGIYSDGLWIGAVVYEGDATIVFVMIIVRMGLEPFVDNVVTAREIAPPMRAAQRVKRDR